jgi:hypothetical protein
MDARPTKARRRLVLPAVGVSVAAIVAGGAGIATAHGTDGPTGKPVTIPASQLATALPIPAPPAAPAPAPAPAPLPVAPVTDTASSDANEQSPTVPSAPKPDEKPATEVRVHGTVAAVNGASFTVTSPDGTVTTVTTTAATVYKTAGDDDDGDEHDDDAAATPAAPKTATFADVVPGARVKVTGTKLADGSVQASTVKVQSADDHDDHDADDSEPKHDTQSKHDTQTKQQAPSKHDD